MAARDQTTTALLTEHFRYTPLTLLDDIINVANEVVFRAVNAIEEGLGATPAEHIGFRLDDEAAAKLPNNDAREEALEQVKKNEMDNGIVKLESLLNATVDKDFDKFEIYTLRNILAVGHEEDDLANWVQLDHYKGIDVVNMGDVPTPEDVQHQRRTLHETAKLNTMLKAEQTKNAAILTQLSTLIGTESKQEPSQHTAPFAFLTSSKQESGSLNLTQNTKEALAQIPSLQNLLHKLHDAMQTIPRGNTAKYDDENSADARRRRYLENQGRRALERKGIDSESSTGGSLAIGRKIGYDELEGIESVAQALESTDNQPH